MSQPLRHQGAGMALVPELLLRQVLVEGLAELAGDEHRLEELVGRVDALPQGTEDVWATDLRAAILRMVTAAGGLPVLVGYPSTQARLPVVSIVVEAGAEQDSGAVIADRLNRVYEIIGDEDLDPAGTRYIEHEVLGVDWSTTLQIGSWALAPEDAVVLHAVAKHLVFRHKGRLTAAGVHDVSLSESGFQPDPQLYPRIGYVPILRCTIAWTWRQTRRREAPRRYTLQVPSFTNSELE